jgi:hypothetical protein
VRPTPNAKNAKDNDRSISVFVRITSVIEFAVLTVDRSLTRGLFIAIFGERLKEIFMLKLIRLARLFRS